MQACSSGLAGHSSSVGHREKPAVSASLARTRLAKSTSTTVNEVWAAPQMTSLGRCTVLRGGPPLLFGRLS